MISWRKLKSKAKKNHVLAEIILNQLQQMIPKEKSIWLMLSKRISFRKTTRKSSLYQQETKNIPTKQYNFSTKRKCLASIKIPPTILRNSILDEMNSPLMITFKEIIENNNNKIPLIQKMCTKKISFIFKVKNFQGLMKLFW